MAAILIPNFSGLHVDNLQTDPTHHDLYKLFLSEEIFQTISTETNI